MASSSDEPQVANQGIRSVSDEQLVLLLTSTSRHKDSSLDESNIIQNFGDLRYLQALENRPSAPEGKVVCDDLPTTNSDRKALADRLVAAMKNLHDIEDESLALDQQGKQSAPGRPPETRAVHLCQDYKHEVLKWYKRAWELLETIIRAHFQAVKLPAVAKRPKEFDGFTARFEAVEEVLKVNKMLVRSVFESDEWLVRIAVNPDHERSKKMCNQLNNQRKSRTLDAGSKRIASQGPEGRAQASNSAVVHGDQGPARGSQAPQIVASGGSYAGIRSQPSGQVRKPDIIEITKEHEARRARTVAQGSSIVGVLGPGNPSAAGRQPLPNGRHPLPSARGEFTRAHAQAAASKTQPAMASSSNVSSHNSTALASRFGSHDRAESEVDDKESEGEGDNTESRSNDTESESDDTESETDAIQSETDDAGLN